MGIISYWSIFRRWSSNLRILCCFTGLFIEKVDHLVGCCASMIWSSRWLQSISTAANGTDYVQKVSCINMFHILNTTDCILYLDSPSNVDKTIINHCFTMLYQHYSRQWCFYPIINILHVSNIEACILYLDSPNTHKETCLF